MPAAQRAQTSPSSLLHELLALGFPRFSSDGSALLRQDGSAHSQVLDNWKVIQGAGAPANFTPAVAASLLLASVGANNDLTLTATAANAGLIGNGYSVSIVQAPLTAALSVVLNAAARTVVITLPADGANAPIAQTAVQVKAAWDANAPLLALFTIAVEGTGAGNVAAVAAAPTAGGVAIISGGSGGEAGLGSIYIKTGAPVTPYINVGNAISDTWKAITIAA